MDHRDIEILMAGIAPVVRDMIANAFKPVLDRVAALEAKELTQGPEGAPGRDGVDGKDGAPGHDGQPGEPGKDGAPGLDGKDGTAGRDGVDGKDGVSGKDGVDGKSIDLEELGKLVNQCVSSHVESLPRLPKSWMINEAGDLVAILEDGEQHGIGAVRGKDGACGASIVDGIVDESGILQLHMSDGRRIQAGSVRGKDGAPGESIQGRAGRDSVDLHIVRGLDETRSYSAGICAYWRGGVIRADRDTLPIVNGDINSAGWSVLLQGIAEEFEETVDDGRTIVRTTVYTSGTEFVRKIKTATPLDRGVWKAVSCEKGDGVTYAGSWFIAQRETLETEKPGQSAGWRLAVKRGRDGQDGKLRDTTPKPVKA